uniref:CSON004989 protein n=1 Tax=Culicoides sonorensis TaxID=179676 RepID=A0A336KC24_CULSO
MKISHPTALQITNTHVLETQKKHEVSAQVALGVSVSFQSPFVMKLKKKNTLKVFITSSAYFPCPEIPLKLFP